jgi:hypothetical protein
MIQKLQNSNDPNKNAYRVLEAKASLSLNLIMVEYCRCRFDKVIQIYHDIQMSPEKEVLLSFLCKLHCQLAMLRLDGSKENKDKVVSLIDNRISKGMADPHEVAKALEALGILRNMKEYDSAIDLGEKLGRMSEKRNITTLENAISHLERYRVECYQQIGKDFSNDILFRVHDACNELDDVRKNDRGHRGDAYLMMLAQRDYLCDQVDDKGLSSQLCGKAIKHVETYLETTCDFERHCFTCLQADTATEDQLVCSGCRVACYCSLGHQRMTWKKGAVRGMRIGHEILCPLMKAYRKWKQVSKKGNERAMKLRRRFESDCVHFLSHGLGLKDKCFQETDVHTFYQSLAE